MAQTLTSTAEQESKYWKFIFITISVLIIIIMPWLSKDYGMSADEWLQIKYGQHIWDYFFKGDPQALDFTNMKQLQYSKLELYGGLFDFPMAMLHHWFPSIELLTLRHFFNALSGAVMIVFTGLLARRLTGKWSVGLVALIFMIFSPRIFGESMNNPKDIPFASGFIIGTYFLVAYIQDFPDKALRNVIGIAIGWGIAFGVRSAGGLLLGAYFIFFIILYYILNKTFRAVFSSDNNKIRNRFLLFLACGLFAGYVIGMSCWPWGLQSPISRPLEALQGMTNREAYLKVLFNGSYHMSNNMPWYYELQWILISDPLIIIAGFLILIVISVVAWKKVNHFTVMLVLFGALFPLFYMVYKKSTVYDTWRHVFFVYPFWVIAAASGWDMIALYIKNEKAKILTIIIPLAGLLPAIIWTFHSHPYQSIYFNELVGGVKGAYGNYELDYYQNSGKEAADWIKKNAKDEPGKKIWVRSNMSAYNLYFDNDTSWINSDYGRYSDRHHIMWDYYVANNRYISAALMKDNKWALQNTVYKIAVDGVPISLVVKRQSTAGTDAYNAYEKKDYATAAQKYAEYVKTDTTDEYVYLNYGISLASIGQIDEGITAVKKAISLAPDEPQYYELLANVYKAKGDMQGYQKAMQDAQSLASQQQEDEE